VKEKGGGKDGQGRRLHELYEWRVGWRVPKSERRSYRSSVGTTMEGEGPGQSLSHDFDAGRGGYCNHHGKLQGGEQQPEIRFLRDVWLAVGERQEKSRSRAKKVRSDDMRALAEQAPTNTKVGKDRYLPKRGGKILKKKKRSMLCERPRRNAWRGENLKIAPACQLQKKRSSELDRRDRNRKRREQSIDSFYAGKEGICSLRRLRVSGDMIKTKRGRRFRLFL